MTVRHRPQYYSPNKVDKLQPHIKCMYISVKEAAKILRIHEQTMYKHVESGLVPHFKLSGGVRIPRDFVERMMK